MSDLQCLLGLGEEEEERAASSLASRPDLLAALEDPRRIYNQDETACELGVGSQWVLAAVNTKQVFGVTSCIREHVTMSFPLWPPSRSLRQPSGHLWRP